MNGSASISSEQVGTRSIHSQQTISLITEEVDLHDWFDSSTDLKELITRLRAQEDELERSSSIEAQLSLQAMTSTWSETIQITSIITASDSGDSIQLQQIKQQTATSGSLISGGKGDDIICARAGWDMIDGASGNDLIHAGNGRDILKGGVGSDELHGDFGWNTYLSEQDNCSDLVAIKSDQWLTNWMYGQAGNNPNGEKCDIIEKLDANDQIKIIGVFTEDLAFRDGTSAHGVSGIGIFAKGALEALYVGGNLSISQLNAMTSGDGSPAAIANQIFSYGWAQNPESTALS